MLFSSISFLYLFLPGVLFFYYVVFRKLRKAQNIFLLIASLFFYAWGEPRFVLVMMASIIVNWGSGLLLQKTEGRLQIRKAILAFAVCVDLGLLFVFKYLNFTQSLLSLPVTPISLPIGISFFTFQAMSYVIDVYRNDAEAQNSLLDVGLYISFFPQLIAGPIVRYQTIANEIRNRRETAEGLYAGFTRFIVGLGKKVLLANALAIVADGAFNTMENGASLSVAYSWLGAICYSLQIFFDFSGYSDMAIGLGSMFGFHFLENFNSPYISCSVSEFWRRWHISLGSWFRDYLYIPLGGSRKGKGRTVLNLLLVWTFTGLWHGANVTFVFWGLMYFVLLTLEKMAGLDRMKKARLLRWCYTIFFVVLGWVIFRSDSMSAALIYLKSMFGMNGNVLADGLAKGWFMQNVPLLAAACVLSTPVIRNLSDRFRGKIMFEVLRAGGLLLLLVLSAASLVSNAYNPFIYFQF